MNTPLWLKVIRDTSIIYHELFYCLCGICNCDWKKCINVYYNKIY